MFYYVLLIFAVGIGMIILNFTACNYKLTKNGTESPISNPQDTITGLYTKEEISEKLIELSQSDPPDKLAEGAMCYKQAAPPNRAEYVCPACNEKTLYNNEVAYTINEDLRKCRDFIAKIENIDLKLDESEFCKKCSPKTENPGLFLLLKTKDDKDYRRVAINSENLQILKEFMDGQDVHRDDYDFETPLKDHLGVLEQIFGIKISK